MGKLILSTILAILAVSAAQETSLRHRRLQQYPQHQGGYNGQQQMAPQGGGYDVQQQMTLQDGGYDGQQQIAPQGGYGGQQQPSSEQQQMSPQSGGFALPASAAEWCTPSILPPLPYEDCTKHDQLNSVPLYGGLTNSLKIVLLGTILSFEEGRCFVVDESESELIKRKDSSQGLESFINRYFEPIGLDPSSQKAQKFKSGDKVKVRDWNEVWSDYDHNRRTYGHLSDNDGRHVDSCCLVKNSNNRLLFGLGIDTTTASVTLNNNRNSFLFQLVGSNVTGRTLWSLDAALVKKKFLAFRRNTISSIDSRTSFHQGMGEGWATIVVEIAKHQVVADDCVVASDLKARREFGTLNGVVITIKYLTTVHFAYQIRWRHQDSVVERHGSTRLNRNKGMFKILRHDGGVAHSNSCVVAVGNDGLSIIVGNR